MRTLGSLGLASCLVLGSLFSSDCQAQMPEIGQDALNVAQFPVQLVMVGEKEELDLDREAMERIAIEHLRTKGLPVDQQPEGNQAAPYQAAPRLLIIVEVRSSGQLCAFTVDFEFMRLTLLRDKLRDYLEAKEKVEALSEEPSGKAYLTRMGVFEYRSLAEYLSYVPRARPVWESTVLDVTWCGSELTSRVAERMAELLGRFGDDFLSAQRGRADADESVLNRILEAEGNR